MPLHIKKSYLFGISEKISVTHFSSVSSVSIKEEKKEDKLFPEEQWQILYPISCYLKKAVSQHTWKLQSSKLQALNGFESIPLKYIFGHTVFCVLSWKVSLRQSGFEVWW